MDRRSLKGKRISTIVGIREHLDEHQQRIADELKKEGVKVGQGWSYEVCLQILLRLPSNVFYDAVELVNISGHKDIGVAYTTAYKKAINDACFYKQLEDCIK